MAVKVVEKVPAAKGYCTQKEQNWERQRVLDGKKSSLCKTYKTQSDANDQVWQLNENMEKALALLALVYERCGDLCDGDKRFDREFDLVDILSKKAADALKAADREKLTRSPRWRDQLQCPQEAVVFLGHRNPRSS